MPNPEQIRYFWLKWIDRQFAKVDPSHVKMRAEVSKIRDNSATAEDVAAGVSTRDRTNKLPPLGNRSKGPSADKGIERPVIASGGEALETKPQLETPGLLCSARNDG
jgi:hypothetical protein